MRRGQPASVTVRDLFGFLVGVELAVAGALALGVAVGLLYQLLG